MLLVSFATADNQDRKRDRTGNQDRDRKRDGSCAKSGTCSGNKNGGNPGGRGGNGAGRNSGKKGTGTCNKSGSASCDGSGRKNAVIASADATVAAADVDVQACDGAKQAGKLMSGLRKSGFNKFAAALQQTGLAAEFPEVMCAGGVTLLAIPDAPMGQLPPAVRGDAVMLREQLMLHVVKAARPYSRMQARSKNYKFACAAGAGSGRLVKASQGSAPLVLRVGRGWGQAAAVTRPDAFRCTGGAVHGVNCALGLGRMGRPGRRISFPSCPSRALVAGKHDPAAANPAAWAQLQQLPPSDRLHTAVLPKSGSMQGADAPTDGGKKGAVAELAQVDLRALSHAQRERLVERALESLDQDNEAFLTKLKSRLDRVGLSVPSVEVRFEDVHVEAGVYVGTRALPTLLNFTRNSFAAALQSLGVALDARRPYPILHGCSGVLRPGRMTLLLGPPGAGKSTLMQALAGCPDKSLKVSGSVTYNGHALNEFVPERTAVYVPQNDEHIGEMTVRETLDFSARLQGPGLRKDLVAELEKRETEKGIVPDPTMDAIMKVCTVHWVAGVGFRWGRYCALGVRDWIQVARSRSVLACAVLRGSSLSIFIRLQCRAPLLLLSFGATYPLTALHVAHLSLMQAMALEGNPTNVITDYVLKVSGLQVEMCWLAAMPDFNMLQINSHVPLTLPAPPTSPPVASPSCQILGLDMCADTVVGNNMLRGISGGQKKRVTTGVSLVGPKQVLLMDEISTGLDSSTTFLITRCLRHLTHLHAATTLVALLQPAPETYELFDDVLLLSEGHVVFHGPREHVLPFFSRLGFGCPARKGEADFLQEVTSLKDQGQYWMGAVGADGFVGGKSEPYHYVSVQAFEAAFKETQIGKATAAHLSVPFPKEKSPPGALAHKRHALPTSEMFRAVFAREYLLMQRNSILYAAQTIQIILIALVTMTVFFRTTLTVSLQDGNYYLGAMFFGVVMMLFNGFTELPLVNFRLPIFYRQRDAFLYPAWAWAVPLELLSMPFSAWASIIWTAFTYYGIGFAPEPGRFGMQMLLFFLIHQVSISLFRLIGAVGRNMVVSTTFGSFADILFVLMGGFVIAKADISNVWIWAYWISPLMYAQNALAVNEFLAPRWNVSAGPLFPPTATMGQVFLESRSIPADDKWVGIGVAALIGYILLFNLLTVVALAYLDPWDRPQPVVSEEQIEAKHTARTGEVVVAAGGNRKRSTRQDAGSALDRYCTSHTGNRDVESQPESTEGKHGMVLPFEPHSLSFHNVNYFVDMPAEMRAEGAPPDARLQLLRNVSGAFRPKVLTALVGVSGAGKTTLMDVLAGRKTGGYIEGDVRVSGFPKVHETFARVAGYCEQSDIHTPQVTVHESLLFSAWLRLPADVDVEVREEFVEEVMELVEVDSLRDAMVGLPGVNGLSTEQRKRLTIAVELVANPSIIFLDEPTSGLDARAAAIVMRTVRNTVDTGRTVVCTIHQPSIDIFEAFDELLLMKRGGEVIYMGPLGVDSRLMIDYFQAIPGVPPIPAGYNPATWMLDISTPAMAQKLNVDFADIFRKSDQFRRNEELIESLKTPPPGQQDLTFATQYARSYTSQFVANLWKRVHLYWRAPDYNAMRYFSSVVMALLIGGVYFGQGQQCSTQQQVLNLMGAMYTAAIFMGWNNSASIQPIVAVERTVFYRERAAGLYGAIPYALAQGAIEVLYVLVQTGIYSLITYAMIQFEWTAGKFWWYTLFMFLTLFYFTCYGLMAIAISPNEQLSIVFSSFCVSSWNLLCGFLIARPHIPVWWRWAYWIDPISWTLYGLNASQPTHLAPSTAHSSPFPPSFPLSLPPSLSPPSPLPLSPSLSPPFPLPLSPLLSLPLSPSLDPSQQQLGDVTTTLQVPGVTPDPTVQAYLEEVFGYQHSWLGYVVLVNIGFIILFFTVFAFSIKKLNFQNR
ncbi:unnamed protein product [Closterium sp. NIES-53]